MSLHISVERHVDAPADATWAVMDDFANIADWSAGIVRSETIGDPNLVTGLGAQRRCDLGKGRSLKEEIVDYTDGSSMTVKIFDIEGLGLDSALSNFSVTPTGEHTSTISFDGEINPARPAWLVNLLRPLLTKKLTAIQQELLGEWAAAAEARAKASR